MKHNIHLHSLYKKLNIEDLQVEDTYSLCDQVNKDRIRKLTMDKVRKEKQEIIFPFKRQLFKAALAACTVLCISGATVFATTNKAVRETISSLLGISQTEILTVGDSIKSKDYELTVHEIACDSYTGIVTISVEALSQKAKETFHSTNIIDKLGNIGSVGYGLRELEEFKDDYSRYFSFSFHVGNTRPQEDSLTFSMEGISKEVKIPITQTVALHELAIEVPSTDGFSVAYQKLYYSELGFTLLGTLENNNFDLENRLITFEFMDGSIRKFYHYYNELKDANPYKDIPATEAQTSTNASETTVANATAPSDKKTIVVFDEEWFSGSGNSSDTEKVTTTFSFSKKMDWHTVKLITVNGTTVRIN